MASRPPLACGELIGPALGYSSKAINGPPAVNQKGRKTSFLADASQRHYRAEPWPQKLPRQYRADLTERARKRLANSPYSKQVEPPSPMLAGRAIQKMQRGHYSSGLS